MDLQDFKTAFDVNCVVMKKNGPGLCTGVYLACLSCLLTVFDDEQNYKEKR